MEAGSQPKGSASGPAEHYDPFVWVALSVVGFLFVKVTPAGNDVYAWAMGAIRWPLEVLTNAKDYLSTAGFSKKGLIEQLSSSSGDQYPHKDAVFAVEHVHVSWKQQAVRSAKNYLDTTSFSCQGLIDQLSSSAGDKYTEAQAQYAANKVGLC